MKEKIVILFFTVFISIFSFSITPTYFEKRIDAGGGYQEFILKNNTNSMVRYKVSIFPGLGKFPNMNEWIEFSPGILTIKPQSESILKLYVKAPKDTLEGEYSAILNLKTMNLPKLGKNDGKSVAATTRLGVDVSLEIVGHVGNLEPKLEILDLKVTEDRDNNSILSFNVKNNTPKRGVYYTIDILKNNGIYKSLEKGRVEFNSTSKIEIKLSDVRKDELTGIILRDSSTYKDITKKQL